MPRRRPLILQDRILRHLTARIATGDDNAFLELRTTMSPTVRARIRRFRFDTACLEDLESDTWLRTWKRRDQLVKATNVAAWILRITANLCIDEHRRRRTLLPSSVDADQEVDDGGIASLQARLDDEIVPTPLEATLRAATEVERWAWDLHLQHGVRARRTLPMEQRARYSMALWRVRRRLLRALVAPPPVGRSA